MAKGVPSPPKALGSACCIIFLPGDNLYIDRNAFAPGSVRKPCFSSSMPLSASSNSPGLPCHLVFSHPPLTKDLVGSTLQADLE